MAKSKISGTKEWAASNINIAKGCEHNCRYCYARSNALRYGTIGSKEEWLTPVIREAEVKKNRGKRQGTIMFPTTHDITPALLPSSITLLTKLTQAGNTVLVVSKPHKECIERLCGALRPHNSLGTDRIFFRFTIGAISDETLSYWEPGAPNFAERREALQIAHQSGFRTSVSAEPMLQSERIVDLFRELEPFITDSFWVGKMNQIGRRVAIETEEDRVMVDKIIAGRRRLYRLQ
jgi:DNA repair photolyase